jgi:energy-coupling factor transporter transmembrane protein EcfT
LLAVRQASRAELIRFLNKEVVMGLCPMIFLLIPVIFLLSLSFFVLVVLSSVKTQTLKVFGYVIVALIWLTGILVFAGGIYKGSKGMYPGMRMKNAMMKRYPGKPGMKMDKFRQGDSAERIICPKMEKR